MQNGIHEVTALICSEGCGAIVYEYNRVQGL